MSGKIKIFNERITLKASRWPWQEGYNWRGMTSSSAPLNAGGARFGGGWRYNLGFSLGGFGRRNTLSFDLLFGMLSISWDFRPQAERDQDKVRDAEWEKNRERWKRESEIRGKIKQVLSYASASYCDDPAGHIAKGKADIDAEYGAGSFDRERIFI